MTPAEARAIMQDLGLLQEQLAAILDKDQGTVSRWLSLDRDEVPEMFAIILEMMREYPEIRDRLLRRLPESRIDTVVL